MSERWVTLAEAAGHHGVSAKTVERWVKRGKVTSRRLENRREVLIESPESDTSEASRPAERQSAIPLETQQLIDRLTSLVEGQARRSRWAVWSGWSGAFALVFVAGFLLAAWSDVRDRLWDTQGELALARHESNEAVQATAEDRYKVAQSIQALRAELQEAILDAQDRLERKIAARTTAGLESNLGDAGAVEAAWPQLGAARPFENPHIDLFAAGLTPGGQGEH